MSIENLKSFDPFADTGDDENEATEKIHIRCQQRNGRKKLTTVQGVPDIYDLKKIVKAIKIKHGCNGHIVDDDEAGKILQFQGDQRESMLDFLVNKLGIKKNAIEIHGF